MAVALGIAVSAAATPPNSSPPNSQAELGDIARSVVATGKVNPSPRSK